MGKEPPVKNDPDPTQPIFQHEWNNLTFVFFLWWVNNKKEREGCYCALLFFRAWCHVWLDVQWDMLGTSYLVCCNFELPMYNRERWPSVGFWVLVNIKTKMKRSWGDAFQYSSGSRWASFALSRLWEKTHDHQRDVFLYSN